MTIDERIEAHYARMKEFARSLPVAREEYDDEEWVPSERDEELSEEWADRHMRFHHGEHA